MLTISLDNTIMVRRKSVRLEEEDEPKLDISSLIDVCFLLLIYFIVTSTIAEPESDLKLSLPSGQAPSDIIDPACFHVLADGSIHRVLDGVSRKITDVGDVNLRHRKPQDARMEELDIQVRGYADVAGDDASIRVKADPDVKAQYVVDLLNVLARHGITQIIFTEHQI